MNAVEFDRVSKSYAIYDSPGDRLRELLTPGKRPAHRDFQALSEVSFAVPRGEVFCIVGENGSGKSTALQLMAGIMSPTSGEVRTAGKIAALLELGAGFNPEFTGRDNVFLNASILGFSGAEIERRFREIEEFAQIGEFIHQPVKTYSSGMVVRLAFAVAIGVDPEILIVDEALAVGDTWFRHRCMRRVRELRARGVTIVFVSHSASDVRAIGDRVMWLDRGRVAAVGDTETVLTQYLDAMAKKSGANAVSGGSSAAHIEPVLSIPNIDRRRGDGRAEILGIAVVDAYQSPVHLMLPGMRLIVRITVRAGERIACPRAGFLMRNHLGIDFAETCTAEAGNPLAPLAAGEIRTIDFHIDMPELYPGAFSFSPWVADEIAKETPNDPAICDWIDNAITVQMAKGEGPVYGYIQLPCRIEFGAAECVRESPEPAIA